MDQAKLPSSLPQSSLSLDFRTDSGTTKRPDPVLEGARYYNKCAAFGNPLDDLNPPAELLSLLFDEDQKGDLMDVLVSSYSASLASSNEAYRFMFDRLLEGEAPMLCAASMTLGLTSRRLLSTRRAIRRSAPEAALE